MFMIGLTKSGFGSGVGLMIVPMTVLAMSHLPQSPGPDRALGLVLPLLVIGDLIAVWQYRKIFSHRIVMRLLPGTALGIVAGGLLLGWFAHRPASQLISLVKIEIGCESVFLVGLHWYRAWREGTEMTFRPSLWRSSAVGAFAGTSSTLAHAAGPIIALHLLPQKLERRVFVGTSAIYFFVVNATKLPVYYYSGQFHQDTLPLSAKLLPLVFAGALFGYWLVRKMSDKVFTRIVYLVTFGLGWYLLFDGIRSLWR